MAMANVIPELWAKEIVELLSEQMVAAGIANVTIASSLNMEGDQFHIPTAAEVTTATYSEAATTITYADPTDTKTTLSIDQDKYAAIKVSDEEALQANQDWARAYARRMANRLADDIDTHVLGLYTEADSISYETGTTDWQLGATGADFPALIASLHKTLDDAFAPSQGRFVILPPNGIQAARLYVAGRATALGDEVARNGVIGEYMGMDIIMSSNLTNETSTNHGICGVRSESIALAVQIAPASIESVRLEGKFGTGIRARAKWGAVTYRPSTLIDVSLNETLLA
jgi:hypothetical protein